MSRTQNRNRRMAERVKILKNGHLRLPLDYEMKSTLFAAVCCRFMVQDDPNYTACTLAEIAQILKKALADNSRNVKFSPAQFCLLTDPQTMQYIDEATQILLRDTIPQDLKLNIEIY